MMTDINEAARAYVSSMLDDGDTAGMTDEVIRAFVTAVYPGGWGTFVGHERSSIRTRSTERRLGIEAATNSAPVSESLGQTLAAIKRQFEPSPQLFHLRPYEEWLEAYLGDASAFATKRVVRFEERTRRDVITATGTQIISWVYSPDEGNWNQLDPVTMWDDEPVLSEQIKWGRVRDIQRVASDRWQEVNCYRPGTGNTPMDGPLAQMETTAKEFFKGDPKQKPATDKRHFS